MRTVFVLSLLMVGLAACGSSDPLADQRDACIKAGGTWHGGQARFDEVCSVRYADGEHFIGVSDGRISTSGRRDCEREAEQFLKDLTDRLAASGISGSKRPANVWHANSGICEKRNAPITAAEHRVIRYSRSSVHAEDKFCEGRGEEARVLARRALAIKPESKVMRRLIRDTYVLDDQQAANRANPGEAHTPAIVVSRCGVADDGPDPVGDADCSDFSTQAEAEAYLATHGDAAGLDANGDGQACESLP